MKTPLPVLVVDDDPSQLTTLSALLEDEGFEVVTATSVQEARAAADSRPSFGAALIDRHLDGEDGMALAAELRASGRPTLVFILSGDPPEPHTIAAIDGWFLKGASVDELIRRLRGALSPV